MMMMRRRQGERVLIGDEIVIHIAQIGRSKVRIGIEAPRELRIVAEEIHRVTKANEAAASTDPAQVLQVLQKFQRSSG